MSQNQEIDNKHTSVSSDSIAIDTSQETEAITIQDTDLTPTPPAESMDSGWMSMLPLVAIFAIFYFFLIRPQEKKRREKEVFVSGVKRGEEVVTNSGIFGTVKKINDSDNTVMLEIAAGTEVKILKGAISDIISRSTKSNDADTKQSTAQDKNSKDPNRKVLKK